MPLTDEVGYEFSAPTRFDKLFSGLAIPLPKFVEEIGESNSGYEHITPADTPDGEKEALSEIRALFWHPRRHPRQALGGPFSGSWSSARLGSSMTAVFNIQGPLRNLQQAAHRPLQGRVQLSQRQKETARHDKTGGPFQRFTEFVAG